MQKQMVITMVVVMATLIGTRKQQGRFAVHEELFHLVFLSLLQLDLSGKLAYGYNNFRHTKMTRELRTILECCARLGLPGRACHELETNQACHEFQP